MSSILKLFSVKAERETGDWLVSSLTEIGTVEASEHVVVDGRVIWRALQDRCDGADRDGERGQGPSRRFGRGSRP